MSIWVFLSLVFLVFWFHLSRWVVRALVALAAAWALSIKTKKGAKNNGS